MKRLITILTILGCVAVSVSAKQSAKQQRTLHIYSTNDIHGHYFDSTYVGTKTQGSLLAVSKFIKQERAKYGEGNVILLDGGDFLQGDNAAYYHNFVDTQTSHIYALMAKYMKYDAVTVGNHDIEAGPSVYNRMKKELQMPFIAANAIDKASGKPHFQPYAIIKRQGVKIAVIGLTNPNMRAWLAEDKLDGMDFVDPMKDQWCQKLVDKVRAKENPDAVIVVIHSGTGRGDGSMLESQGLDLYNKLHGVDLVVCAHDHRPHIENGNNIDLINAGSHCNCVGHATLTLQLKKGKVVAKDMKVETIDIDKDAVDSEMAKLFHPIYEKVKAFSTKEIGTLEMPLSTRAAFRGMCDYLNFVHSVCLEATKADICFAAPLKFNGFVRKGTVLYNDLFTIYPYENQLFVLTMTGAEIKDYLEASYDAWINTVSGNGSEEHVLKIVPHGDPRTGQDRWSFVARSYNFDSASGINYTVDVTAPKGKRVNITTMANGESFSAKKTYKVATTSYRANGGGSLMKAAGIPDTDPRIIAREKEIRDMVYDYFMEHGTITAELVGNPALIGSWKFVPESIVKPLMDQDMNNLFPKRK